jgi:hypothetical protein
VETDKSNKLKVVLAEYSNIRTEIRDFFRLNLQVFAIVLSAIALLLGYSFVQRFYGALVIVPLLSIPLFYQWLWDQNAILALSYYQETEIERKKIPSLIGFVDDFIDGDTNNTDVRVPEFHKHWIAWQLFWRYHMAKMQKEGFLNVYILPVLCILLIFPLLGSVGYTIFWTIENLRQGNLDIAWLVVLIVVNLAYLGFTGYGIMLSRTLNEHFRHKFGKPDFVI